MAFYNTDIKTLTHWLAPKQGLVAIAEDATKVNLKNDVASIQKSLKAWQSAWIQRNASGYQIYLVHTDRLTAFDRAIGLVPYRGAILASLTEYWMDAVKDIIPTHLDASSVQGSKKSDRIFTW